MGKNPTQDVPQDNNKSPSSSTPTARAAVGWSKAPLITMTFSDNPVCSAANLVKFPIGVPVGSNFESCASLISSLSRKGLCQHLSN